MGVTIHVLKGLGRRILLRPVESSPENSPSNGRSVKPADIQTAAVGPLAEQEAEPGPGSDGARVGEAGPGHAGTPRGLQSPRDEACLLVLSGESIGRIYRFVRDTCLIGRAPASDIALKEESIAWQHAEVKVVANQYILRATDPTNELYVNGLPTQEQSLTYGDRIQFGDGPIVKFALLAKVATASASTEAVARPTGSPKTAAVPSRRPV